MEKQIKLIKYYKDGILKSPRKSKRKPKEIQLYKLDIPESKSDFKGYNLPPHLEEHLENAVFALSYRAKDTIEYLLSEAPVQRHMPLYMHYDTSVRETLMEIGSVFLEKAVYLLCDYLYNEETQYYVQYNDEINKSVMQKLILYKYWKNRTGRGMQKYYAKLDDKIESNRYYYLSSPSYHISRTILEFEKRQEQLLAKFPIEEGPVQWKSAENFQRFMVEINYSLSINEEFSKEAKKDYAVYCLDENDAKNIVLNSLNREFRESYVQINKINIKKTGAVSSDSAKLQYFEDGRIKWIKEIEF